MRGPAEPGATTSRNPVLPGLAGYDDCGVVRPRAHRHDGRTEPGGPGTGAGARGPGLAIALNRKDPHALLAPPGHHRTLTRLRRLARRVRGHRLRLDELRGPGGWHPGRLRRHGHHRRGHRLRGRLPPGRLRGAGHVLPERPPGRPHHLRLPGIPGTRRLPERGRVRRHPGHRQQLDHDRRREQGPGRRADRVRHQCPDPHRTGRQPGGRHRHQRRLPGQGRPGHLRPRGPLRRGHPEARHRTRRDPQPRLRGAEGHRRARQGRVRRGPGGHRLHHRRRPGRRQGRDHRPSDQLRDQPLPDRADQVGRQLSGRPGIHRLHPVPRGSEGPRPPRTTDRSGSRGPASADAGPRLATGPPQ